MPPQYCIKHLDVSSNKLNGSLPSGLGSLPNLLFLDVSHNESSVQRLADYLSSLKQQKRFSGQVHAVCGMLADKEISVSMAMIAPQLDYWHLATIHNERGSSAEQLSEHLSFVDPNKVEKFDTVELAYQNAKQRCSKDDCLLVFGSFHIAGDILALVQK